MKFRTLIVSVLTVALAYGCSSPPFSQAVATSPVKIADLREASGIIAATTVRDGLWLINDSSNSTQLFLSDLDGNDLGHAYLLNIQNVDWEAMSRFDHLGKSWLLIADVGDNNALRQHVVLYFMPEPKPPLPLRMPVAHRLAVGYPDGARDVESVAVDPVNREILLLSKRDARPRLYAIPLQQALTVHRVLAEYRGEVATIPALTRKDFNAWTHAGVSGQWISQPTDMAINPAGNEMTILTYNRAYRYGRSDGETWLDALNRKPEATDVSQLPKVEALTYLADGSDRIIVASEGRNQPLLLIEKTTH